VKGLHGGHQIDKRSERIEKLLGRDDWADRTARLFCEGWFGTITTCRIMLTPKLEEGARRASRATRQLAEAEASQGRSL